MLTHNPLILLFLIHLLNLTLQLHIILLLNLFRSPLLLQLQLFFPWYFVFHKISIHFISLLCYRRLYIPLLHLLIKSYSIRNVVLFLSLFILKIPLCISHLLNLNVIQVAGLIFLGFILIILLHKLIIHFRSLIIRSLILIEPNEILLPR